MPQSLNDQYGGDVTHVWKRLSGIRDSTFSVSPQISAEFSLVVCEKVRDRHVLMFVEPAHVSFLWRRSLLRERDLRNGVFCPARLRSGRYGRVQHDSLPNLPCLSRPARSASASPFSPNINIGQWQRFV
jgi:hypothetical protein